MVAKISPAERDGQALGDPGEKMSHVILGGTKSCIEHLIGRRIFCRLCSP